jgi:hypothetical protein
MHTKSESCGKRIIDSPRDTEQKETARRLSQELFNQNAPSSGEDHYFSLFISKAEIASRMTNSGRMECVFIYFFWPLASSTRAVSTPCTHICEGGLPKLFIYAHNWGEKHSIAPAFSINRQIKCTPDAFGLSAYTWLISMKVRLLTLE